MLAPAAGAASGDLDVSFGAGGVEQTVLTGGLADGVVGQAFDGEGDTVLSTGSLDGQVLRVYGSDGTPDAAFGVNGAEPAPSGVVAVDGHDRIYMAHGGDADPSVDGVYRYLPSGTPDTTFSNDGFAQFASPFPTGLFAGGYGAITLYANKRRERGGRQHHRRVAPLRLRARTDARRRLSDPPRPALGEPNDHHERSITHSGGGPKLRRPCRLATRDTSRIASTIVDFPALLAPTMMVVRRKRTRWFSKRRKLSSWIDSSTTATPNYRMLGHMMPTESPPCSGSRPLAALFARADLTALMAVAARPGRARVLKAYSAA